MGVDDDVLDVGRAVCVGCSLPPVVAAAGDDVERQWCPLEGIVLGQCVGVVLGHYRHKLLDPLDAHPPSRPLVRRSGAEERSERRDARDLGRHVVEEVEIGIAESGKHQLAIEEDIVVWCFSRRGGVAPVGGRGVHVGQRMVHDVLPWSGATCLLVLERVLSKILYHNY